jgi:hypothetical protein
VEWHQEGRGYGPGPHEARRRSLAQGLFSVTAPAERPIIAQRPWSLEAVRFLFFASWLLAVSVALLPILYFIFFGSVAREAEFTDKVLGMDLTIYFRKFWAEGSQQNEAKTAHLTKKQVPARLFRIRYRSLVGRWFYLVPGIQFVLMVTVLSGLVVATAMRAGYENYVRYYAAEANADTACPKSDATPAKPCFAIGNPIVLPRMPMDRLDQEFWPLPKIQLSLSALAAIAGGYLFVVAQIIQQCRARSLVYYDLYGASLRILIAVPLGLSVQTLLQDSIGPFISFGLGAFPVGQLGNLMRRLSTTYLKTDTPQAADDMTIAMVGVTQVVSDTLAAENITCAQQLADVDPVLLAVRTGLSFDYVIFLAAQSLVWCFLGKTAAELGPVGLADARAIASLMQKSKEEQDKVFLALPAKAGPAELLRLAFGKIAQDPYTRFLVQFTGNAAEPMPPAPDTAAKA